MHEFDIAPGLDPEQVEADWNERGVQFRLELFSFIHALSTDGPNGHEPCPGGPMEDFLLVYALPIPNFPGQKLRIAYDTDWGGFWYLGLGPDEPPCDVARHETATLMLGSE